MNKLQKEIKGFSALQLTMEFNRILALADNTNPTLISLSDAKKLLYVEEELKNRLEKLLPGLPKVELSQEESEEPHPNYMNVIMGSYYERKSKLKSKQKLGRQIRFFVRVKNSMNSIIASIPVNATDKNEALKIAKEKSVKFGTRKLTFEVS